MRTTFSRGTSVRAVPFAGPTSAGLRRLSCNASAFKGEALPVITATRQSTSRQSTKVMALSFFGRGGASSGPMKVAITGATGLVGTRLVAKLMSEGNEVVVLTRNVGKAASLFKTQAVEIVGDDEGLWEAGIKGCYGVINLAGEPIATRWDDAMKLEIKRSRVDTTLRVANAINALKGGDKPKVFVSSSAVGYYGVSETETFKESSKSGNDFLAEICRDWEGAANTATGVRTVIIRTGIVLAKEGGALAKMIPVFSIFTGGPLGSGRQWMSWVHRDDLVNLMIEALKNPAYKGAYNGTAPNPVRMGELCSELGSVMGRPSWLPVPEFALQGLLGEGATIVLEGQKAVPSKACQNGFKFKYETIDTAVTNILER